MRGGLFVTLVAIAFGLTAAAVPSPVVAQTGWLPTSWFSSESLDPQAMYPLSEKDGPWLVLATTFRGAGAREDARRLVHELRGPHKLKAYTHEKAFDYTGTEQGLGLNPDGTPKKMRYAKAEQVVEVAVLVGDFASFDDPRGQKMLAKVKSLQPATLSGESGKSQSFSDFRKMVGLDKKAAKGPMHMAFVIPNPLLPEDFFSRAQIDDFVLEMNADVTHSLLDCPGRYTVRVATFTGARTFAQQSIAGGGKNLDMKSQLVEAAERAHTLTQALRKNGWQAWEYHDRDSSIVCVGSLDQLQVKQANGTVAMHPEIKRIIDGLGPDPETKRIIDSLASDPVRLANVQIAGRQIAGILLDVQPKPIDVPRAPANWR